MLDLIEPAPLTELTQVTPKVEDDEDESANAQGGSSAKVNQLLKLLDLIPSDEKSLVFSQFTSFLDKVSWRARDISS